MSRQYFTTCDTVEKIKSRYRELAKAHHPDLNPDDPTATETMKAINAAYKIALQGCDGQTTTGTDKRQHTYKYNETHEQAIIDKIHDILASILPDGVSVWLIGTWVWVRDTDRADTETRDKLKALKMRWSSKRGAWHWTASPSRRRFSSKSDLNGLAAKYGASQFRNNAEPRLA